MEHRTTPRQLVGGEKLAQQLQCAERDKLTAERAKLELEQKLSIADNTISSQKKEIFLLKRKLQEPKLQQPAAKERSASEPPLDMKEKLLLLEEKCNNLSKDNEELIQCIRKQSKLIDVLKRQKLLLEAGSLLTISEKEFKHFLELEKA